MEWQAEVDCRSPGLGGRLLRELLQTRTKADRVYLSPCNQPRSHRLRQLDLRSGRLVRKRDGRWRWRWEEKGDGRWDDGRSCNVIAGRLWYDFEVGGSSW
jgi:hypothetical protein